MLRLAAAAAARRLNASNNGNDGLVDKPRKKQARQSRACQRLRYRAFAVLLIGAMAALSWLRFADRLPWGGKATSCTIKELRDTGALVGLPIDEASREGLRGRGDKCMQRQAFGGHVDNGSVAVAFLIWTYEGEDVRREYATTNSEATPGITDECRSWCKIYEARNTFEVQSADLIMFSPTDHGRAYGNVWCRHPYPKPFTDHIAELRSSSLRLAPSVGRKQYWGAWTFEHVRQFPQISDPHVTKNIDMTMNYRQDSDVPVSWFCEQEGPPDMRDYYRPVPDLSKKQFLLSAVGSRCRNDWKGYVDELSKYLPKERFRRYGACWGYESRIPDVHVSRFQDKILELAKSKFVLVFENSKEISDYISEKLSHALLAGSVPVIWGAPNAAEYLPGNHSAILVSGKNIIPPKKLAELLLRLDANDTEYLEYFEWKHRPPTVRFEKQKSLCFQTAGCRLCDWVRRRRRCDKKPD